MYAYWLDETYGKTKLGLFWEYTSDLDHIQAGLDIAGFFWDGFDLINAAIYFCRGKWQEGIISLACALPFLGSLVAESKGMRKIVSKVEKLTEGVNIGRLEVRAAVKSEELPQLEKDLVKLSDAVKGVDNAVPYLDNVGTVKKLDVIIDVTDEAEGTQRIFRFEDEAAGGGKKQLRRQIIF